jgi:hypothetical protein
MTKRPLWSREGLGRQAVMVLLLIVVAWWGYRQFYPADAGPLASNAVNSTAPVAPAITAGQLPPALKLGALEPVEGKPAASRNPFRFGEPPPPPPPPPRPVVQAPPPPPPQPVVQAPPQPVGPPQIPLKFVGVMQLPNGTKVAALTDGRGTLTGREGDVIDGRYRIVRIGVESIVMEYVDGKGRQTIPLRGTEP